MTRRDPVSSEPARSSRSREPRADSRVAYVVNPTKATDLQLRDLVTAEGARRGQGSPIWRETTPDDAGGGAARDAIAHGATLVVACGGDGTVNAVAATLVHSPVALGIVPLGTGNLLAQNFGIPSNTGEAIGTALEGRDRRVDTGRLDGRLFLGMAGTGLDAAMVRGASPTLKRRFGWIAYVPPAVRSLRHRFQISVTTEETRHCWRSGLSLIAGNVGALHGGLHVLPEASPDDGILDVAVLAPAGLAQWSATVARLLARSPSHGRGLVQLRGTHFDVELNAPRPLEVDGEAFGEAASFEIEIEPASLILRVPR